jgi:AcrR family transcriptional regulator
MKRRLSAFQRREQILTQASRIFAQKGFRGTTTREIARAAGISEALMFKHFPSKASLYRAIIQRRMGSSEEIYFPKEYVQAKDDRQVFRSIASYLIRKNTEDPAFMRQLMYSALEGHELARYFFEHYAMERTRLLSEYIEARIREMGYRKVPPLLAARAFIGMIIHYAMAQEVYGMKKLFHFPEEQVVDTFVDIFLEGLKGKNSECPRRTKGR